MISFTDVLILIWMHCIIDYVFQSRKSAQTKHKDNVVLLGHCVIYSLPFFYFGWLFALVNGTLHFAVDYVTSRTNAKIFRKKKQITWAYVCVLGFDQLAHLTFLFLTYKWLVHP